MQATLRAVIMTARTNCARSSAHPDAMLSFTSRSTICTALLLAASVLLPGCGSLTRNPVPPELVSTAIVPGLPYVRSFAGQPAPHPQADLIESYRQESRSDFPLQADGTIRYPHLLVSGGGANGAFGAGLLSGWTGTGQRPVFKIVTGISTGALIAPFAFIGSDQDETLKLVYTTTRSSDIFAAGSRLAMLGQALFGEALADTGPLARMIAGSVDEEFVARVARAHRNGRRLYIGSTDLDARRFVVWNMGLIALADHPQKVQLFRQVMLASASIPVVFPPVFFDVEVNGKTYDEMHVDGAVIANVFFTGGVISPRRARREAGTPPGRDDIYAIHNGQLVPTYTTPISRNVGAISARVLDTAARSAVIGDLFRVYTITRREEGRFNWVTIPNELRLGGEELFDPVAMTSLYEVGLRMGKDGSGWRVRLPGEQETLSVPEEP